MNKPIVLTTLSCLAAAAVAEPIDRSVDADPEGLLEVSNVAGEISIEGWDEDRVRVTGDLSDDAERLDVINEGNRVIVRVVMPDQSGGQRGSDSWDDTELRISAPRGMSLEVSSVSADISVRGIEGEQELNTVSGDIGTESRGEEIRAKSVSGDILVSGQDVPIRTDVSAVSGDVLLDGVSGEVEAQSVSGDVELNGRVLARGELKSVSGDLSVHAELAEDARLRMTTTSGDVELLIRGSAAGNYELSTFGGDVENCFGPAVREPQFGPPARQLRFSEGESNVRVSVNTMSGDIELCRE